MNRPMPSSLLMSSVILLNRLSLGFMFLLAGIRKFIPAEEGQSVMQKLSAFAGYVASQAPLPQVLGQAYGYALPFVETVAGGLLVIGVAGRVAAGLITLMLLSFIIAMGPDIWPPQGAPFSKEIVLLTLAAMLTVTGPGRLSLDAIFDPRRLANPR